MHVSKFLFLLPVRSSFFYFPKNTMAKIKVIGSSSGGNGYVVDADGSYLFIECGVRPRAMLRAANYHIDKVEGCLISHSHKDHCDYASEIGKMGVTIVSNAETIRKLGLHRWARAQVAEANKWIRLGDFFVMPFECQHDVKNFGYIIRHPSFGSLFFGTDTFAYPVLYTGIDHYLIEANYSDGLLAESNIDKAQRDRLLTSHMSLEYCLQYLHDCRAPQKAKTITLIHLSSRHSDEVEFKQRVERETGVPTYIADAGVEIDISNLPNI